MFDSIRFVGGDDLIDPFQIVGTDGRIVDLDGATITGRIIYPRGQVTLSAGAGLEISELLPSGDNPHGFLVLTGVQTAVLPLGALSRYFLSVLDKTGRLTTTETKYLERVQ